MIAAGELNQRVAIQSPKSGSDGYGVQGKPGWDTVATVYAKVHPLRAYELVRAKQVEVDAEYVVTIRYTPLLNEKCQLVWLSKELAIAGIIPIEGNKVAFEIMCYERRG
jgi:SPP1 family predicted phage head-tail adaptor